jgi:very-short-patch-repair endonuclease
VSDLGQARGVDISELMLILGGVAGRRTLVSLTSRADLEEALTAGQLVRINRGRYAVPGVHAGTEQAARVSGHVCLISAALSYSWAVKTVPDLPQVAVPKDRRLSDDARAAIEPIWVDLGHDEVEGLATSEAKTLEMCGRRLPFDEALAIFDSALRAGYPADALREAAASAKGPGSARLRRVAALADKRAANPFESVLRAIARDVPGLTVEPQVRIRGALGLAVRPDLVDRRLRIVIEADSFEWHGDRAALRRDARRYDLMVANGWIVLCFVWEDVMHDQDWVRSVLTAAVERTQQSERRPA